MQAVLSQENSILKQQLSESHFKRSGLQGEMKAATKYLTELEDKVYDANTKALDLLKQVRHLELENATLKTYVIDLKSRVAVYLPVKDD